MKAGICELRTVGLSADELRTVGLSADELQRCVDDKAATNISDCPVNSTPPECVTPEPSAPLGSNMALSFLLVLAATVILIRPETPVTKALHQNSLECCGEKQRVNNSCSNDTHCEPGCFLRFLENSNTVCIFCDSAAMDLENITVCTYNYTMERKNHTTVTTVIPKIGGPGVAASLLLGTLLISLFLILSVASFFYLKRSNRLPNIFYRRNKAFIFQPSETAVMIPSSSVRKPRYVRRERPSATSTGNSATVPTTTTTQVYNV